MTLWLDSERSQLCTKSNQSALRCGLVCFEPFEPRLLLGDLREELASRGPRCHLKRRRRRPTGAQKLGVLFFVEHRMPSSTKSNTSGSPMRQLLKIAKQNGRLTAADVRAADVPLVYLNRLVRTGAIEKVSRGIYQPTHARNEGPNAGLVLVALRAPHSVISLLSALSYHGLTTQSSPEVWVTVGLRSRSPKLEWPPLRVTRLGGAAFTSGVERHLIDGIEVPIYSAAKTVADLFKFRSKVGLDVALEALQAYRRRHRGGMDELHRMAKICRVDRVMQPYLEALSV